jgi:hypothetical protein
VLGRRMDQPVLAWGPDVWSSAACKNLPSQNKELSKLSGPAEAREMPVLYFGASVQCSERSV